MSDDQQAVPETAESGTAEPETAESTTAGLPSGAPPHPPSARSSDEYTDPPGHHRRGPHGPALDVGA